MANKHQQISIGVDFIANLDKFTQGINNAKGIMSKLDISEQTRKGIDGLAEKMAAEINKIKDVASRGKVDIVDVNKINTSMKHIESAYAQMISKIEDMGGDSTFLKNDAKALKVLKTGQDNYTKAIADTERAQKRLNENLEKAQKAQKEGGKESKKKAVSDADYRALEKSKREASAKLRAADEKKAIASKKVEEKIANSGGKYSDRDSRGFKNTAAYQEEKKAIEEVKVAELELQKIQKQLGETTTFAKQEEEAKKLATNVDNAEKELKDFLNTQKQTASIDAFEKVKKSLLEMKGINWNDAGIDPNQINNIEQLEQAMTKLGTDSVARLQAELPKLNGAMESSGNAIQGARVEIDQMAGSAQNLDSKMSQLNAMKQRITYFFGLQNAAMLARRAFTSVFNTIKELDEVMTETAVVTDFTVGDMWKQLPQYTDRANEFGLAIKDVYEADTLFYQQGLKTNEVVALSNETMKMARIAGLDTAEATDRMTNALRGFNMELNEANAQNVADVYSELAAISASDVNELSVAMTKTASIASNAGASFENTAAFIAQIVETTRESAETAGTALKTVIARFTELKKDPSEIGEVDGEVVDANKIETALRSIGVSLRDANGQFRDFDDVILELSSKWDSLDTNTQRYIATIAAGSRQQSRFIALMSNNARLTQLTAAANSAAGASQKQYEKTLESLETKLNRLKNAANEFLTTIGNSDVIKGAVDVLTGLLNILNKATSWGPRWVQMFTKTAAAIGLFVGLKKVVETGLAKIGATMGLQGAAAGTAYTRALDKTMNKGLLNTMAKATAQAKAGNFKNLFSNFISGKQIEINPLKNNLTDLMNNRRGKKSDELRNEAFEIAKNSGKSDEAAIKTADSFMVLARRADEVSAGAKGLTNEIRQQIIAERDAKKAAWEESLARDKNTASEKAEELANKGAITAEQKEMIVNEQGTIAERAEILANGEAVALENTEAATNAKAVLAEEAEIRANMRSVAAEGMRGAGKHGSSGLSGGLLESLKTKWNKISQFFRQFKGILIGLTIVAASVVGAVHLVDNAFYTLEERMDGVDKAVQAAADRFSQLTDELQNFGSTKDSIKSMAEELNQLKYGTTEWSAKALELNSVMGEIFANNQELNKEEYTQTLNGIKVLNDAGWEKYQEILVEQTRVAQQTSLALQQTQTGLQAQMNLDQNGYSKAISSNEQGVMVGTAGGIVGTAGAIGLGTGLGVATAAGVGSGMAGGAAFGAALGSWAGPIGAAIGVAAGAIIGTAVYSVQKEHYEKTGAAYEEAVNLAAEQGFVANGATDAEIDEFLGQLNASAEYIEEVKDLMKQSADQFDETVKQQAQYNSQLAELNRQYAASLADEHGMSAGETERFQDVYDDLTEEITDYQEKILEVMRDKYDAEAEEFKYDKDLVEYYKQYAEANGLKFNAKDKDNPFGEDFDYSQITNNSIVEFVAAQEAREAFEGKALELLEENNQEIRTNNKSIYNQLLNQMGQDGKNNDWIYDATSEQIKMMENALIQAQLRGGSSKEMGSFISKIMNAAAPDDIEAVRDILFATDWSDVLSIKALEESLENFGIVLGENFISELTEASAALDGIDVTKLTSVVETLEEFINSVAGVGINKRIFSKEDMETAVRGGFESSDFKEYSKDAEGNTVYVYTGDQMSAEEIQLFLQREFQKNLQETVDAITYAESGESIQTRIGYSGEKITTGRRNLASSGNNNELTAEVGSSKSKEIGNGLTIKEIVDSTFTRQGYTKINNKVVDYQFAQQQFDPNDLIEKGFVLNDKYYTDGVDGAYEAAEELVRRINEAGNEVQSAASLASGNIYYTNTQKSSKQQEVDTLEEKYLDYERLINQIGVNTEDTESSSLWDMYEQIQQGVGYTTNEIKSAINEVFTNVDFSEVSPEKFLEWAYNQYYGENGEKLKNNQLEMAKFSAKDIANYYDAQAILDNQALIGSSTALEAVNNQFYAMDEQVPGLTNKLANFVIAAKHNQQIAYALGAEYGEAITYIDSFAEAVSNSAEALTNDVNSPAYLKATQTIAMQAKNIWGEEVNAAFVGANADLFYSISKGGNEAATAWQQIGDIILQQRMQADGLGSDIQNIINFAIENANKQNFDEAFNATEIFNSIYGALIKAGEKGGPELMNQVRSYFLAQGIEINVELTADQSAAAIATAIKTNYTGSGDNELVKDIQYWEGSYDRFYNLLNDINAELRERNKLEREFKDLTDDTPGTAQDIQENLKAQAASLRGSIQMNKDLKTGREDEMERLLEQNPQYKEFIGWNDRDGTLEINWNKINAQRGVGGWTQEEGADFEEHVSALEELAEEIYDLDETIMDTEDQLEELQKTGRDEYLELEQTIYDAIIGREEKLIEELQNISTIVQDSNSDLISGLQKSINKMRQDRQNEETTIEISDQERQFAYLSQSTIADPLEIMQLQDEIEQKRQDYTDSLIDQKISELEDQNEQARVQREKQIAIAQAQLDYNKQQGFYWNEVHDAMKNDIINGRIESGSDLDNLMKNQAGWNSMSEQQQLDWTANRDKLTALAEVWTSDWTKDKAVAQNSTLQEYLNKNGDTFKELSTGINSLVVQGASGTTISNDWASGKGANKITNKEQALAHVIASSQTGKKVTSAGSGDYDLNMDNIVKAFGAVDSDDIRKALEYMLDNNDEFSMYGKVATNLKQNEDGSFYGQVGLNKNTMTSTGFGNYSDLYWSVIDGEDIAATNTTQESKEEEAKPQVSALSNKNVGNKLTATGSSSWLMSSDIAGVTYFSSWKTNSTATKNGVDFVNVRKDVEYDIVQTVQDAKGNYFVKIKDDNDYEWLDDKAFKAFFGNNTKTIQDMLDVSLFPKIATNDNKEYQKYSDGTIRDKNNKIISRFKTGGLADFTGPAWLDGTKSAPEIVLNAQDTKNFLQLRDILSDLFKGGNFERSGSSGDNYYDIDINVDEISNDYDVDQLAARIKQQIVQDSMYRNVNAINFMR